LKTFGSIHDERKSPIPGRGTSRGRGTVFNTAATGAQPIKALERCPNFTVFISYEVLQWTA